MSSSAHAANLAYLEDTRTPCRIASDRIFVMAREIAGTRNFSLEILRKAFAEVMFEAKAGELGCVCEYDVYSAASHAHKRCGLRNEL